MEVYLIIADMDGGTNIWRRIQTFQGTNSWKEARYDYLDDINAVIDAIEYRFEYPLIYLLDIHEESYNFPKEPTGRSLIFINGIHYGELPFFKKFPKIEGAFFVGFHPGPGEKGFAPYLFKPKFKKILVNGETWGELEYFALILHLKQSKLLFVSGTEEVTKKAKEKFPWVKILTVSKEPGKYRGNVAAKRYVMGVWEEYREKIGEVDTEKALIPEGVKTPGEVLIQMKDSYRAWCLKMYDCQREKKTIRYSFEKEEELINILFFHSYFNNSFSPGISGLKLAWQNNVRNLKSKGIIKGL